MVGLSSLLQSLNMEAKVTFGYECHMEPFKEKIVHFYPMKWLIYGGLGLSFQNSNNTSLGKG
jgi:hypothetical protein